MIVTKLIDGTYALDNCQICVKFKKDLSGAFSHQEILFRKKGQPS